MLKPILGAVPNRPLSLADEDASTLSDDDASMLADKGASALAEAGE
jgi:hypothetical protein